MKKSHKIREVIIRIASLVISAVLIMICIRQIKYILFLDDPKPKIMANTRKTTSVKQRGDLTEDKTDTDDINDVVAEFNLKTKTYGEPRQNEIISSSAQEPSDPVSNFESNVDLSENEINLNFYMNLSETITGTADTYAKITGLSDINTPDKITDISSALIAEGDRAGKYKFICPVPAKNMSDDIYIQFFDVNDNALSQAKCFSVKKYCEEILNHSDNESMKADSLIRSLLNYGAAAQIFFDTQKKNANESFIERPSTKEEVMSQLASYNKNTMDQYTSDISDYYGTSLLLKSQIKLRLNFKLKDGKEAPADATIINDRNGEPSDIYYYEQNISPIDFDKEMTIVAGSENTYSVNDYIKTVLQSSNEKLKPLVCALYDYGVEAQKYISLF